MLVAFLFLLTFFCFFSNNWLANPAAMIVTMVLRTIVISRVRPLNEMRDGYFITPVIAGMNNKGRKDNKKPAPS